MTICFSDGTVEKYRRIAVENGGLAEVQKTVDRMLSRGSTEEQIDDFLYRKFGFPKNFRTSLVEQGLWPDN